MQTKYEYLTKKEVIDNIVLFKNQLKIELGLKTVFVPEFDYPLKNKQTIISSTGHSFTIENVGRCRYNLTISN